MAKTTKTFGLILIAHGVLFFALGSMEAGKMTSMTALIPAFFGVALYGFGVMADHASERARMHVMHVAVLIGLMGVFGGLVMGLKGGMNPDKGFGSRAVIAQVTMGLICLYYVVLCVRSFIDTRKARSEVSEAAGDEVL